MGAFKSGCERAREWVSLELDGELSELEDALLRAHLDRCVACAAFARDARAFTRALRAAPSERPAEAPAPPRSGGGRLRVLQLASAAAAVAAAVGLGGLAGSLSSRGAQQPEAGSGVAATQQPYFERKLLALDARLRERDRRGRAVAF